jgi:hypothetical protein
MAGPDRDGRWDDLAGLSDARRLARGLSGTGGSVDPGADQQQGRHRLDRPGLVVRVHDRDQAGVVAQADIRGVAGWARHASTLVDPEARACSTASRLRRPKGWALEGLPKPSRRKGSIASSTSSATCVVAL